MSRRERSGVAPSYVVPDGLSAADMPAVSTLTGFPSESNAKLSGR